MNLTYNISYSNEHKFIWYRTAKCGTRSILTIFENNKNIVSEDNIKLKLHWEQYFKFTIVRNPWDRLLSAWKNKVQKQWIILPSAPYRLNAYKKYKDKSFSYFVKNVDPSIDRHTRCLSNLIDLKNINYIGRFENLQHDFDVICNRLCIPQQQLPHKNVTKHAHYTEYYNDVTRVIIERIYAKDIERFGYKFGE